MLRWRLACALGSSTWSTPLRYLALTRSTLTSVQSGKGHHGRRVRIFRSVATTKHPSQPSTSSVAKSVLTRSIRARRLGSDVPFIGRLGVWHNILKLFLFSPIL